MGKAAVKAKKGKVWELPEVGHTEEFGTVLGVSNETIKGTVITHAAKNGAVKVLWKLTYFDVRIGTAVQVYKKTGKPKWESIDANT